MRATVSRAWCTGCKGSSSANLYLPPNRSRCTSMLHSVQCSQAAVTGVDEMRTHLGAPGRLPVGFEAVYLPHARPCPSGVCAMTSTPSLLHSATVPSSTRRWSIREYSICVQMMMTIMHKCGERGLRVQMTATLHARTCCATNLVGR